MAFGKWGKGKHTLQGTRVCLDVSPPVGSLWLDFSCRVEDISPYGFAKGFKKFSHGMFLI